MTSDQDPQPAAPIFGDMTVGRAEEIESLLKDGRKAEVPAQELQEYQEFQKSLKAAVSPVIERYAEQMASAIKESDSYQRALDNIAKSLSTPFADVKFASRIRIVPSQASQGLHLTERNSDDPLTTDSETVEVQLSIVEQAQLDTLAVMKAMAKDAEESKEKLARISAELEGHKEASKKTGKNAARTLWIAFATLLVSVLLPFVTGVIPLPALDFSGEGAEQGFGSSHMPYGYK